MWLMPWLKTYCLSRKIKKLSVRCQPFESGNSFVVRRLIADNLMDLSIRRYQMSPSIPRYFSWKPIGFGRTPNKMPIWVTGQAWREALSLLVPW